MVFTHETTIINEVDRCIDYIVTQSLWVSLWTLMYLGDKDPTIIAQMSCPGE